ncbi:hypothetical protein NC653_004875 [Populus alba x Populus x berolinensis]|uniref:Uncharacterized protein n=1 Tax=Populus alba x Populus x berolinensis TaxID=444605 RepID=A0AAD6RV28_9ROSI|nr:hypothetical protein NC653_004875 [Populus alba x Populus x berolinensis]
MTGTIPDWWGGWGYWVSPLSYGFNAIAVNELSAPRWITNKCITGFRRLYHFRHSSAQVLWMFYTDKNWYWIGTASILVFCCSIQCSLHLCSSLLLSCWKCTGHNTLRKQQKEGTRSTQSLSHSNGKQYK